MPSLLPIDNGPLGRKRAAHLLRRTTFGPSANDIARYAQMNLQQAMDQLFIPSARPLPPLDVATNETWVGPASTGANSPEWQLVEYTLSWWTERLFRAGDRIHARLIWYLHTHYPIIKERIPRSTALYHHMMLLWHYGLGNYKELAVKMSTLPADKKFINKVSRLFEQRLKMIDANTIDWALGEWLAYASLLSEGKNIRISGEDVERGTFSHRHAIVKTEDTEEEYIPLRHISESRFDIYNSHLSEYGVLGFDYGYAMASPNTLTIWEAQFGDFVNGAQIIVDQYLAAAEEKWKIQNGLVMLLPHGSEGQGAEHSSARLERFLGLCANENMIVANCTTPANFFHILRRQLAFGFRKPLIVMSPKSLLRHPKVISTFEDLAESSFQPIIDDATADASKVSKLVLCSGKIYYELLAKKEKLGADDVALVRIEQLYPLHAESLEGILTKYSGRKEIIWAQEEPENMGAWSYILRNFRDTGIQVVAPVPSGAPAPGSHKMFERIQSGVINRVFDCEDEPESRPVTA